MSRKGDLTVSPTLILASASPRRKEILEKLGVSFQVQVSAVDENICGNLSPDEVVQVLANMKAKAVAEQTCTSSAIVMGADTLVAINKQVLGKPSDTEEAKTMLSMLQGKTHQVYTGISLLKLESGKVQKELTRCSVTNVTMRALSPQKVNSYVHTEEPMDKAGSYGIQGRGSLLIEKVNGCYFNVVGLPVSLLDRMLEEWGVSLLVD